jgi:hypothetical protein
MSQSWIHLLPKKNQLILLGVFLADWSRNWGFSVTNFCLKNGKTEKELLLTFIRNVLAIK